MECGFGGGDDMILLVGAQVGRAGQGEDAGPERVGLEQIGGWRLAVGRLQMDRFPEGAGLHGTVRTFVFGRA